MDFNNDMQTRHKELRKKEVNFNEEVTLYCGCCCCKN